MPVPLDVAGCENAAHVLLLHDREEWCSARRVPKIKPLNSLYSYVHFFSFYVILPHEEEAGVASGDLHEFPRPFIFEFDISLVAFDAEDLPLDDHTVRWFSLLLCMFQTSNFFFKLTVQTPTL